MYSKVEQGEISFLVNFSKIWSNLRAVVAKYSLDSGRLTNGKQSLLVSNAGLIGSPN
jgi:hypothetical protein